jgi:SAM-dependent methyltransferase
MPRHAVSRADAAHYQQALELGSHKLQTELRARTNAEVYELCFSRLTRADPFGLFPTANVRGPISLMIGTDQRDQFVPILKRHGSLIRHGDHVLDLGCGDGQMSRFLWGQIKHPCAVTLVDPNEPYLTAHAQIISSMPNVSVGEALAMPMDIWLASQSNERTDEGLSYRLVLMLHSMYFAAHLSTLLHCLLNRTLRGGRIMLVFADEVSGYTGTIIRSFIRHAKVPDAGYSEGIAARHKIFGIRDGALTTEACAKGLRAARITHLRYRFFGHSSGSVYYQFSNSD